MSILKLFLTSRERVAAIEYAKGQEERAHAMTMVAANNRLMAIQIANQNCNDPDKVLSFARLYRDFLMDDEKPATVSAIPLRNIN